MSVLEALLAEEQAWPDIFPARLSPSSIALAASCPEKFRRKYILDERERWGGAAIVGIAVHRAVEEMFAHKLEHGDLPDADMAQDVTRQAFADKTVEAEKDGIDWGDTKPGDAVDQSILLTTAYHGTAAPNVEPVAVEEWVGAQIPGLPELSGRIDVIQKQGILDVKTTGRKMTEPRGDWRLKGSLYVLMTGQSIEWNVITKTKTPGVYTAADTPGLFMPATPLLMKLTERRVQAVAATLIDMLERYGPEEPWPTNATEHDWACSYCSFKPDCRWWS